MFRVAFSFVLALFLAACGEEDPRKALVGGWRAEAPAGQQGEVLMTLTEEGKVLVKIVSGGRTTENGGTWSLTDDGKLTLVADNGAEQRSITCDYEIKDDSLRLSGENPECADAPLFKRA